MPAIETHNLRKVYTSHKKQPGILGAAKGLFTREKTEVEAVKGVSLTIEQGELVGFLGPNGAGKTTTLKMLSGILHPTSGEAKVLGFTPSDRRPEMLRKLALVMGNKMQLWWDLPAWDSFVVLKELYEVDDAKFKRRTEQLIETLDLKDKIHTQVRKLSLGERMKCELIAALLHSPQVVFLDEPTIGLDVVSQKRIRDFLKELHKEDGCTIILTSHYMQDVQELCDRVIVIDHGNLVFDGELDSLANRFSDSRRIRLTFTESLPESRTDGYGTIVERTEDTATIEVPRKETAAVASRLLLELPVDEVSIEDVEFDEVIRALFESEKK